MPGGFDLTEYGHLRDIPEMIRQMGVPYTGPAAASGAAAAAPAGLSLPVLLQYLSAAAPWALLGGAGMVQGGSADPNVMRFYEERDRQTPMRPAPELQPMAPMRPLERMRPLTPLRPPARRLFNVAPRQPFAF